MEHKGSEVYLLVTDTWAFCYSKHVFRMATTRQMENGLPACGKGRRLRRYLGIERGEFGDRGESSEVATGRNRGVSKMI